ncbi:HSF-type DNA-binding-domain-containing protein [Endogone sp. FLAS-F59071]|nr:HSF-type DNA-binding-domain-containing protein [Endogone sp. FLAS-F59071]|eukprot:RUS15418.1 HSF-type DNA-binding-domain-containing protein [Endogone sp. FLAS-F59071]
MKANNIEARQLRARQPNGKRIAGDAPASLATTALAKPKLSYSPYPTKAILYGEQSRAWQDGMDSPNSNGEYNEDHDNDNEGRSISTFVSKLYSLLEEDTHKQYLRWTENGSRKMFTIDQIEAFAAAILPHHFKHCKFASFVRQLNIYGFKRDTDARKYKGSKEKESCRWYHPYFLPGRRELLYQIRRKAPRFPRRKMIAAMKHEGDEGVFDNSGEESETEQKSIDWSHTHRPSYTPYPTPSKIGHQDDITEHPKNHIEELIQAATKQLRRDYKRKNKLFVAQIAETNTKLAAQHQFLSKLIMFIKNAFPNCDQELQNMIDSFNDLENAMKACPVVERRISGDLNASSDSSNVLSIDSFNPRLGTIASVGTPFPSIHNLQSPNSSITSTPNNRSPMTPESDYSIAFGDIETYKPNFRPEGSMNIGEVQQWSYADQQQTGMALTQFRTKQQTYPSHQSMITQPTNSQLSYMSGYFKE